MKDYIKAYLEQYILLKYDKKHFLEKSSNLILRVSILVMLSQLFILQISPSYGFLKHGFMWDDYLAVIPALFILIYLILSPKKNLNWKLKASSYAWMITSASILYEFHFPLFRFFS